MATIDNYKNKLFIGEEDIANIIDKSSDGSITDIKANGDSITIIKKDGSASSIKTTSDLPEILPSELSVGPSNDVSYTFPSGTSAATTSFTIPYFTVDSKGRVTSATNRTVTVTRPAYSNYGNYANYTSYNNYANYTSYGSYSSYHNYSNYTSYGSND